MVRNTSNIAHHCSLFVASSPTVLLYSYRSATPTGNPRTKSARNHSVMSREVLSRNMCRIAVGSADSQSAHQERES